MAFPSTNSADLITERDLETEFGCCTEYLFRYANSDIVVATFGNWQVATAPLVRIHSTCLAAHYLKSTECDCREQLELAFDRIKQEGAGLVVVLEQDGRGSGHAALMRAAVYARDCGCTQSEAYAALGYPKDMRRFDGAGVVLRKLGLSSVTLLSHNLNKVEALQGQGIQVVTEAIIINDGERFGTYYRRKALESQYRFEAPLPGSDEDSLG